MKPKNPVSRVFLRVKLTETDSIHEKAKKNRFFYKKLKITDKQIRELKNNDMTNIEQIEKNELSKLTAKTCTRAVT